MSILELVPQRSRFADDSAFAGYNLTDYGHRSKVPLQHKGYNLYTRLLGSSSEEVNCTFKYSLIVQLGISVPGPGKTLIP